MGDLLVGDYVKQNNLDKFGLVDTLHDDGTFYAVWYIDGVVTWENCSYDDVCRVQIMDLTTAAHLELLTAYVKKHRT